ncbi:MAG TPA: hypothetical protein VKU60_07600, partial [Chloroflexota bacterium]|nr:hypothetical protein [Chloroflexota bacterium]
ILREELRIHRQRSTDVQVFEDTLRRDHVVVEDPQSTGLLRERYPTENESEGPREGFFESFKRKMMQP